MAWVRLFLSAHLLVIPFVILSSMYAHHNNNEFEYTNNDEPPITVAYAISLIKCGDRQSNAAGMTDAALVLRHSIHKMHEKSKYNYKMYAIVHPKAEECSHLLKDAGFEVLVRDQPIYPHEIQGELLRKNINKEWCCGSAEFIKLYAYDLPEPLFVHMDIDFVLHRPMDELFDVLLDVQSPSKHLIPLERPNDPWPADGVEAFLTRDWGQNRPGPRPPGYQAGLLVGRRKPELIPEIVHVIREGNYSAGYGMDAGWGGKGYGVFVGAMAMQGLLAYFYDHVRQGKTMELNQCRYNHMGMDTLYRAPPNFHKGHAGVGKCRNGKESCEDCQTTPLEDIYSIHYTQCRKPWNCIGEPKRNESESKNIPADSVIVDHCLELQRVWHNHRRDLEEQLIQLGAETVRESQTGEYKDYWFKGHCKENGGKGYLTIGGSEREAALRMIPQLYQ